MKFFENLFKKKEPTRTIYEIINAEKELFTPKPKKELYLEIPYNTQIDNKTFALIKPIAQCAYTSIAMVLSKWIADAAKDIFISDMILNFEKNFLAGKSSRCAITMNNHVKIFNYYIQKYNLDLEVVFIPHSGTIDDIVKGLEGGSPILFSWKPTPHGHFSTIVGYSEIKKSLIIHDPFYKFDFSKKRYSSLNGSNNCHAIDDISPYMNKSSSNGIGYRMIYLRRKTK